MSSQAGVPFLGSKITLISKNGIRYEGILYNIDSKNSSVALKDVRMFGTEGRRTDGRQIPPMLDKVFDFIQFKGEDIRDLTVCEGPQQTTAQPTQATPAPPAKQAAPEPKPQQQPQQQQQRAPVQASSQPQQQPGQQPESGEQVASGFADSAPMNPYGPYGFNPYLQNQYGWNPYFQGGPMGMNPQFQMPGYGYPFQGYPGYEQYQQMIQQQQYAQQEQQQQQPQQPSEREAPKPVVSETSKPNLVSPASLQKQQQQPEKPELPKPVAAPITTKSETVVPVMEHAQPVQQTEEQKAPSDGEAVTRTQDTAPFRGTGTGPRRPRGAAAGPAAQRGPRTATSTTAGIRADKFKDEFDFESANKQFDKLALKEELGSEDRSYYDRQSSFFDNISRDTTKEGGRSRQEREDQNKLDYETFGVRGSGHRGRGRGGRGRGGVSSRGGGRGGSRGGRSYNGAIASSN